MSKQLAFEGIQRKSPKRHDLEDQFALDALKKQSLSLKWLVDHSIVTKDTRDRVSCYTAKEIA